MPKFTYQVNNSSQVILYKQCEYCGDTINGFHTHEDNTIEELREDLYKTSVESPDCQKDALCGIQFELQQIRKILFYIACKK